MMCMSEVTVLVVRDGLSGDCQSQIPLQLHPLWCDTLFDAAGKMGTLSGQVVLVTSVWSWVKLGRSFVTLAQFKKTRVVCWLQEPIDLSRLSALEHQGFVPDMTIQSGRQFISLWQDLSLKCTRSEIVSGMEQRLITLDGCDVSDSEMQALMGEPLDDSGMIGGV